MGFGLRILFIIPFEITKTGSVEKSVNMKIKQIITICYCYPSFLGFDQLLLMIYQ